MSKHQSPQSPRCPAYSPPSAAALRRLVLPNRPIEHAALSATAPQNGGRHWQVAPIWQPAPVFGKSRPQTVDASLTSLYRRDDAYWLIAFVQSASGLWMTKPNQVAATFPLDAPAVALGSALVHLASQSTPVVEHPKQDEWKAQREASLGPLIAQAKVRSWRAFESGAQKLSVARTGCQYDLTPMLRGTAKLGAWQEDTSRRLNLKAPDALQRGEVVLAVLSGRSGT